MNHRRVVIGGAVVMAIVLLQGCASKKGLLMDRREAGDPVMLMTAVLEDESDMNLGGLEEGKDHYVDNRESGNVRIWAIPTDPERKIEALEYGTITYFENSERGYVQPNGRVFKPSNATGWNPNAREAQDVPFGPLLEDFGMRQGSREWVWIDQADIDDCMEIVEVGVRFANGEERWVTGQEDVQALFAPQDLVGSTFSNPDNRCNKAMEG